MFFLQFCRNLTINLVLSNKFDYSFQIKNVNILYFSLLSHFGICICKYEPKYFTKESMEFKKMTWETCSFSLFQFILFRASIKAVIKAYSSVQVKDSSSPLYTITCTF